MALDRVRRVIGAASLTAVVIGGGWALGVSPASAAPTQRYVATSGSDGDAGANDCSTKATPCKTIQHAVDSSAAGDTINIGAGTYAESVSVGAGDGKDNLTLVGAGASATKITGGEAAGGPTGVGLLVGGNGQSSSVMVRDLALSNVRAQEEGGPGVGLAALASDVTLVDVVADGNDGAGILAEAANVTASGSHFDGNGVNDVESGGNGEGSLGCGVLVLGGQTSLTTSTTSRNSLCGAASAAQAELPGGDTDPTFAFTRSTAAGNHGPGLLLQGTSDASVVDSTLSGNQAGGVYLGQSNVTVTHSTITGTKVYTAPNGPPADEQAAIAVVDEPTPDSDARVAPAQVKSVNNSLAQGLPKPFARKLRAMDVKAAPAAAAPETSKVAVSGSIVADNTIPDCSQKITDAGYNISEDKANSCGLSAAQHSQAKTDPKLGSLGDHGGATQTQLPLKASPAIDAQPAGQPGCTKGATDQRGVARAQPTGGRCDIGAVELAAKPLAIAPGSLPHGTVGKAYHVTLTATGGQYPSYTWSLAGGSLPPGVTFANGTFSGTPTKAGSYSVTVSVNDPVTRTYTIVIDAAATNGTHGSNGGGSRLADTGVPTLAITGAGLALLLAGLIALFAAGMIGRPTGRHRIPTS